MFFNDHPPPHFHVRYGEQRALVAIETLRIVDGTLSPRALGLVVEWAARNREALRQNWERARNQTAIGRRSAVGVTQMLHDIVDVTALGGYRPRLTFDDGVNGEVDLSNIDFSGVFAPLADPVRFAEVHVDRHLGTIVWPNGADLDPVVLYAWVTGKPLPEAGDSRAA